MEQPKSRIKSPTQHRMVRWYSPMQLCKTAVDVIISLIFGRHADFRLIEALNSPQMSIQDYSHLNKGDDFWIDYTADVGDGWNSTYSIAYYLSHDQLTLHDDKYNQHITKRGQILIFGGDGVYPVASCAQYHERLVAPYTTALPETKAPHPDIYMIPGNHDWYDSLTAYSRLFCAKRWFAGWRTQQERSYFALKLPYHWWLIGTDIQLDSDIDDKQVQYFKDVAKLMQPEDKIVLCTAEPEWIFTKLYGQHDQEYSENNIAFFENNIFKNRIKIYITGDLHHYRRHENNDGAQKIIAGGGGAFLHPTHGDDVSLLTNEFKLKKAFPDIETSRKLCWRNLGFLFLNPTFGLITGLLYLFTVWSIKTDLTHFSFSNWQTAMSVTINQALKTPIGTFWIIAVLLGFLAFTDTHYAIYRTVAGLLHGITHLLAAFFIGWSAILIWHYFGFTYDTTSQLLLCGITIFIGGWIIGSIIMGLYLLISLNFFNRHSNEAFSSLAIQDWKNFLRIKIDKMGNLTIFPIGLKRVPRKWTPKPKHSSGPLMIPDDLDATPPELIEPPIIIKSNTMPSP